MPFVYVLWSQSICKRYVGSTSDINKRLADHNAGRAQFTKGGRPWTVITVENCDSVKEARRREAFLKSGIGRAWLDQQFPDTKL